MKNKISKLFLTVILCLITLTVSNKVKAQLYNGSGGIVGGGSGYGDCGSKVNCLYNNTNMIIIKLTLVYSDNGSIQNVGAKSFYLTDSTYGYNFLTNNNYSNIKTFESIGGPSLNECVSKEDKYSCASTKIKDFFGAAPPYNETANAKKVLNYMLNRGDFNDGSNYYKTILNKASEYANENKPATKGYRIFIEPVLNVKNVRMNNGSSAIAGILTVKELAQTTNGTTCTGKPGQTETGCGGPLLGNKSLAQYLYTNFDDVGVTTGAGHCENIDRNQLASATEGCGYNIVDISHYSDSKKCYTREVHGDNIVCTNTDRNNVGEYYEEYKEVSCDKATKEEETNTENGKLVSGNNTCGIYCVESAKASLPGNISYNSARKFNPTEGSYFAWPSKQTGLYPLSLTSKYTCKIVSSGTCDTNNLVNNAYEKINKLNFSVNLTAGTNKEINAALVKTYDDTSIKQTGNDVTFERKTYFNIDSKTNRCFNKESKSVTDGINCSSNKVFDRQEGVVSLKEEDHFSKSKYDLKLSNVYLGSGNQFGKLISGYTCSYKLTFDSCSCPLDSWNPGYPIDVPEGNTCADTQQQECYGTCKCPDYTTYAGKKIDVNSKGACIEKINDKEFINTYCEPSPPPPPGPYYCTKPDGTEKPITKCVNDQKANGLTINEAVESCVLNDPECNYTTYYYCPYDTNRCTSEQYNKCIKDGYSKTQCNLVCCPKTICGPDGCKCETDVKNNYICSWKLTESTNTRRVYKWMCNNDECDKIVFQCPGGDTDMKDPTSCINEKLGISGDYATLLNNGTITSGELQGAFYACQEEVCPYGNKKIVYRVIDLTNPFPGKENQGIFRDFGYNGRKPGANWNSKTLVESKILKARGVTGYELYKKEPLYTIKLDTNTIKEIREYNKNNKYTDFNMTCTYNNKSSKCVSNFLHDSYRKIILSGKCAQMGKSSTDFDECYNNGR